MQIYTYSAQVGYKWVFSPKLWDSHDFLLVTNDFRINLFVSSSINEAQCVLSVGHETGSQHSANCLPQSSRFSLMHSLCPLSARPPAIEKQKCVHFSTNYSHSNSLQVTLMLCVCCVVIHMVLWSSDGRFSP